MKKRLLTIYKATAEKNKLPLRLLLSAGGIVTMGFCMSIIEKLRFGTDPYTCLNNGLSLATGLSLGTWGLIVSLALFVIVIALRADKIGFGTLFNMVGFGYSIDLFRFVWSKCGVSFEIESFILRLALLLLMLFVFILAVSLYLASDLGCAPYDAVPEIISEKSKIPFVAVRMCWDICAVVGGILLGSAVGVTTVVCAVGVGPCAQLTKNAVNKLLK